ncbi:hypothetical protein V6N12_019213 [Hibiscus sabdariffa]|uniref:Uncharacterized protein n=1 Tax=Hibiscus sabdariffa TaxID=183260 RepID=A0ABR2C6X4_9ROSI
MLAHQAKKKVGSQARRPAAAATKVMGQKEVNPSTRAATLKEASDPFGGAQRSMRPGTQATRTRSVRRASHHANNGQVSHPTGSPNKAQSQPCRGSQTFGPLHIICWPMHVP